MNPRNAYPDLRVEAKVDLPPFTDPVYGRPDDPGVPAGTHGSIVRVYDKPLLPGLLPPRPKWAHVCWDNGSRQNAPTLKQIRRAR